PTAERLLGHTATQALGQVMHQLVHSKHPDGSPYPCEDCPSFTVLRDGITRHLTNTVFWHRDGHAVHVDLVTAAIREGGRITGSVVVFTDTTERQQLLATLQRWEDVFTHAKWGVVIGSADGQTLELMNPAFAQMHGYTVKELTGHPIADVFAPHERPYLRTHLQRAHDQGHLLWESWHLHKDGTEFPVLIDITPVKNALGQVQYRVVNVQDISARHATEKVLRESEERYRMLADNSSDMIFRLSDQAIVNYASPACRTHLGFEPESMQGQSAFDFCVPQDQAMARQAFEMAVRDGQAFVTRLRLTRHDGSCIWTEASCQRIEPRNKDHATEYVATVRDIGERVSAEEKVINSEANLAHAQAVARVGSWRYDMRTHQIEWSAETYRIFGIEIGTPIDYSHFMSCIHPEDRQAIDNAWQQALKGARYDIQHRITSAGSTRWVHEQAEIIVDASGTLIEAMGTVQDISDWHASQQELLASRQAVRELAAHNNQRREEERTRIAREIHDHLGQNLTALRMDTARLSAYCATAHPELLERVQQMTSTIDETIDVVRDVSTALRPACLDLGLLAATEWLLAGFEKRTGIRCTLVCAEDPIDLDNQQATATFRILQEALNNVARHAQASTVRVQLTLDGTDLRLEVIDDGVGVDTTAGPSKKSFGIIGMRERALEAGGHMSITRAVACGTHLEVWVPVSKEISA
ncbi:MAG: PAS domain S-box protein, partial [Pseudomonadota bacterium]